MPRLKDFIAANPQIRITISCQSTYQTLKLLEEDKIDIGLIGRPQKLSGYEFLPLLQIQDTFVATHQYLENQHQLFHQNPFSTLLLSCFLTNRIYQTVRQYHAS